MAMSMVVAVVMEGLGIISFLTVDVFRGRGQGVVDALSSPSLDEIEGMIEHACGGQSFEIFVHRPDTSRKSDHEGGSYGSSYWTRKRCKGCIVERRR